MRTFRGRARRTFVKRVRPNRQWSGVASDFTLNVTATGNVPLIQLQSPATLANLTADPPEDLTIMRMVGEFLVSINGPGGWILGLTVADVTWTPGATFNVDADKRWLWIQEYHNPSSSTLTWFPKGIVWDPVTPAFVPTPGDPSTATRLDITPKVKVEDGKALYLVAYEESGSSGLVVSSRLMRVLYQRSGKR